MSNIYKQYESAFSNIYAFCIMGNGDLKFRVSFKYPKDGAGRLWAYVNFLGLEMVRAYAGGYGYDKASAAVSSAVEKITVIDSPEFIGQVAKREELDKLQSAFKNIGGKDWQDVFRDLGYTVFRAV